MSNLVEADTLNKILGELDLPKGQWVLAGSGVLVLHGINPRPIGDVDIFMATRPWFDLYLKHHVFKGDWEIFTTDPSDTDRRCDPPYLYFTKYDVPVNIFFNWRTRGIADANVNKMIQCAETVQGWPCVPMQYILDIKREINRPKDQIDIEVLEEYLEEK